MQYRKFGRTDMVVPEIGIGGGYITGKNNDSPDELAVSIVRRAMELGCTYIDTAPLYGTNHGKLYGYHRSEICIGMALKDWHGPCTIATKVGCFPQDFDYKRDSVLRSCEQSLKRLQRNTIDLLQIHQCEIPGFERIMETGGTLDGLRELQKQGIVRYIGVTGYDLEILVRLVDTGIFDAVLNYNRYDLYTQEAKWRLLPVAARHNVAYVAGSPLHSGMLGARRESRLESMAKRGENVQAATERLARIDQLIAPYPDTLSQMALRYLLSDPQVAVVIPSASKVEQVEENVQAGARGPLPSDLVEALEAREA